MIRKIILRTFQVILGILLLGIALLYLTDNAYVIKGVQATYLKGTTTANINDHVEFNNRIIMSNQQGKKPWAIHANYNKMPLTDTLRKELEQFHSAAFLVIKDGEIWAEEYWGDYEVDSKTNSFSMAKTLVTMLLGAAIEDGYIKSLDQPITDFLDEYKNDPLAKKCTVGDLSAMTAGYDWKEDYYWPLNPTAKAYYGDDMDQVILTRKFITEPGGDFKYLSGVTQLLGYVITRATKKSLSSYLSEKFWQPMGMEHDALWALDHKNGMEKAYCCVYSNARDFSKLGLLLLQNGKWGERQLLDSAFVKKMVTPNLKAFSNKNEAKYGYSVWTDAQYEPSFYAMLGHLGQRVIVIPEHQLIICRLGEQKDVRGTKNGLLPGNDIYYYVDEVMKMIAKEKN